MLDWTSELLLTAITKYKKINLMASPYFYYYNYQQSHLNLTSHITNNRSSTQITLITQQMQLQYHPNTPICIIIDTYYYCSPTSMISGSYNILVDYHQQSSTQQLREFGLRVLVKMAGTLSNFAFLLSADVDFCVLLICLPSVFFQKLQISKEYFSFLHSQTLPSLELGRCDMITVDTAFGNTYLIQIVGFMQAEIKFGLNVYCKNINMQQVIVKELFQLCWQLYHSQKYQTPPNKKHAIYHNPHKQGWISQVTLFYSKL